MPQPSGRSLDDRLLLGFTAFLACSAASLVAEEPLPRLLDQRPQPWQRRAEPVLSARSTAESWCRVVCYSPHVLRHDGSFHMWYLGTSTATRTNKIVMGYATSPDGIHWQPHPKNPVLTGEAVPWGQIIQTPYVLFDEEEGRFKMWFVSGKGVSRDEKRKIIGNDQRLGYATSRNGIDWDVHPDPIYRSGRSPVVIKESPQRYRMWMGSRPEPEKLGGIYANIYEFTSSDGLQWKRSSKPALQPSGPARSVVYPFVVKVADTYYMWYGCHVDGGRFEIFCAKSPDGTHWQTDHARPAFPAAMDRQRFDGRYTSTPCIVQLDQQWRLYYSARDWKNTYLDGQGRIRRDGAGVYAHIGVASLRFAQD